jgi:predicted metal-dependent hydrolase
MNHLIKENQTLKYNIVYKPIKHTYFKVKADHILVTTHKSMNQEMISNYLMSHFEKFNQKIKSINPHHNPEQIILKGKPYRLIVKEGNFSYQMGDDEVIVFTRSKDVMTVKKRIFAAEIMKSIEYINPHVKAIISQDGLDLRPIKIKYLKSKFGSYHKKKDFITLNSFLATCDDELLIYVIFHEYVHVLVFNHSNNFYEQLQKWLPNHRTYQKRLKNIAIY